MISWSYYGLKAWPNLFGEGAAKELTFKVIFCLLVVIGAASNLDPMIDFPDAAIFAMAVVNIIAPYLDADRQGQAEQLQFTAALG